MRGCSPPSWCGQTMVQGLTTMPWTHGGLKGPREASPNLMGPYLLAQGCQANMCCSRGQGWSWVVQA